MKNCISENQIMKNARMKTKLQHPIELHQWSVENISSANFVYVSQDEYINTDNFLANHFSKSIAIKGMQKLHGFIIIASSTSKVKVKTFSHASESMIEKVCISEDRLKLSEIKGYYRLYMNITGSLHMYWQKMKMIK